jgi:hypothetical protein
MTIILPYKQDIHDGEELRYALRSIEKYLTGFTNLIIIGRPPEWYKGTSYISENYVGRKQYSIYQKILLACNWENVTENFIMWNDDHFLLQPLQVSDIKYWNNGWLANEFNRGLSSRYSEAVKRTLDFIPDALNFDIHTPIIYNKAKFRTLFTGKENEICIKSYYCNSLQLDGEFMDDCKIDQLLSKEGIYEVINGKMFFSTGSNGIREPMKIVLEELYPNKSRWEV